MSTDGPDNQRECPTLAVRSAVITDHSLAVAGFFLALGALIVSWVYGHKSAGTSKDSATSLKVSADAAERSAVDAHRVADAELGRDHREQKPEFFNETWPTEFSETLQHNGLFYEFTLPRNYRMYGDSITGPSRSALSVPLIVSAGIPVRVFVGHMDGEQLPEMLNLRFFPPDPIDPGEKWSCPCGRAQTGDHESTGHWEWNVPVDTSKSYRIEDSLG